MAFKINKLDCKINPGNLYSGRVCDIRDFLKITMNDFHLPLSSVFYPFVKDLKLKHFRQKSYISCHLISYIFEYAKKKNLISQSKNSILSVK